MKRPFLWLLLRAVGLHAMWCETSARTGCRGKPRQLLREAPHLGAVQAFDHALSRVKTDFDEEPIVVDWDRDGDWDLLVRTQDELKYFEMRPDGEFVQLEPNPFKDVESPFLCRPALVDWNGDGRLDVLVASVDGIRYYENMPGSLEERTGAQNPFNFIAGGNICGDLAVADWDGDGDLDLLLVYALSKMRYFEQVNGSLHLVNDQESPFQTVLNQTLHQRPLLADWNDDGRMDLLLMAKVFQWYTGGFSCSVLVHLQLESGLSLEWFDLSPTCELSKGFKGSGLSLVDIDGDGDLDAVFGSMNAPLHALEHKVVNGNHFLEEPARTQTSSSFYLSEIDLGNVVDHGYVENNFKPILADWDMDGDLDLALIHPKSSRFFEHQSDGKVIEISEPPSNYSCPIAWRHYFSMTDFDGDGLLDLLGFGSNVKPIVCRRVGSDFVFMPAESTLMLEGFREGFGASAFLVGFPTFLDWDGDGDVDILKLEGNKLCLQEQLSNGTFHARLLPVPMARDFFAVDFDGDGDVDLMMSLANDKGCIYFERKGDGSLQKHSGADNPFHAACAVPGTLTFLSTLGDWNEDGEVDAIVVHEKINLWHNRGMNEFIAYTKPLQELSFPEAALHSLPRVSLVDVDHDGDLDLVVPPQNIVAQLGVVHYRYYERLDNGALEERFGTDNPFHRAPQGDWDLWATLFGSHMIVDMDGDGHLDIVRGPLQYARQEADGRFVFLEGDENPFKGISPGPWDCWTLVDWDGDGDMDFVLVEISEQPRGNITNDDLVSGRVSIEEYVAALQQRGNITLDDLVSGRVSKEEYVAAAASRLRFFEQSNSSFTELVGAANPLVLEVTSDLIGSLCPSFVDLDEDGDLDLILENPDAALIYYEHGVDGQFTLKSPNPFAGVSISTRPNRRNRARASFFVDWDGDGLLDLVNFEGTDVQYFQRGVCEPEVSYCSLGVCKQQALASSYKCQCLAGAVGDDCSLCGHYHVREGKICKKCPGYMTLAGTCSRRGVCEDDADARAHQEASNESGFTVLSALGTGRCTCSAPFFGLGCRGGACPPGQRLDRNARTEATSVKYPSWEACVPCEPGRYKNRTGNEECYICPVGLISSSSGATSCEPCPPGFFPTSDRQSCRRCDAGYVAEPGDGSCTPCRAGTAPDADKARCATCSSGRFALERSPECSYCPEGFIPNEFKSGCGMCSDQSFAFEGDDRCQTCFFPLLVMGVVDSNLCSPVYSIVFLLVFLLLMMFVILMCSCARFWSFRRRLDRLVQAQNWKDLHSLQTHCAYGFCKGKVQRELAARKEQVKTESLKLGVSLTYVLGRFETDYDERATNQAVTWKWHQDDHCKCEFTKNGFFSFKRTENPDISEAQLEVLWSQLPECPPPETPNFHQVASVLAYGPWALSKDLWCPRDGERDCSMVDALRLNENSAKANWFLSWVWSYKLEDVKKALNRWFERHTTVTEERDSEIYIWWCMFVNNQFRMLEHNNQALEPEKLFSIFGEQLKGIGKMLMCFDKLKECAYPKRIWCIFEVFTATHSSIPTTVILPDVAGADVSTLQDLTQVCHVDAEKATATVETDAVTIKEHIIKKQKGYEHVNQKVEKELLAEVIHYLEAQRAPVAPTVAPTARAAHTTSAASAASAARGASESTDELVKPPSWTQCNLQ